MIGLGDILTVGKGALGLAQNPTIKLGIMAAMLASSLAFYQLQLHHAHVRGVAEERARGMEANRQKTIKRIDQEVARLAAVNAHARDANKRATALQETLDGIKRISAHDIIEATSKPNCNMLCPDNFGLWFDATRKPDGIPRRNE